MSFLPLAALLLSALVAAAPAPALAAGPSRGALQPLDGEVIVKFKADAGVLRRNALAARAEAAAVRTALDGRAAALGTRLGRTLQAGPAVGERMQVLRSSGMTTAALAARLAADADVEYAVPNGRRRLMAAPNDPLYAAVLPGVRPNGPDSGQWYLRAPTATVASAIDIEAAWARSSGFGSASVVVAVLDTGVRGDHPDLNGRLLPGYDFVTNTAVANDGGGRDADATDPGDWVSPSEANTGTFTGCRAESSSWHGTSTASLVGAAVNDSTGMAGSAPGVKILPVRVLGKCFGSDSDILPAMRWAAGIHVDGVPDNPNPAKVLNMSLGGGLTCNAAYQDTVNQVLATGATIVVSAGNSEGGPVEAPANCAGVVAVTALRHIGTKVGFSSLGAQVAISAPGGNCVNLAGACLYPILAATNTGTQGPVASGWTDSYNISVGTSFSAPLVAGVVGLMYSSQPLLTGAQVKARLQATARPFPTTGSGAGIQQCVAPSSGVAQDECYCNTTYCGAGMMDAGQAVLSVSNTLAVISVTTATPTAGAAVVLSAANSLPGPGTTVTGYAWTITSGGGIVNAFTSASNAATATLTPSAAGSFTVQVAVADGLGNTSLATQTVTVAAAPVTPPVTPPAEPSGGGGGATGAGWLLALAASIRVLRRKA